MGKNFCADLFNFRQSLCSRAVRCVRSGGYNGFEPSSARGRGELKDVVINSELLTRTPKAPNYEAENQALMALAQCHTHAPEEILLTLAETA